MKSITTTIATCNTSITTTTKGPVFYSIGQVLHLTLLVFTKVWSKALDLVFGGAVNNGSNISGEQKQNHYKSVRS